MGHARDLGFISSDELAGIAKAATQHHRSCQAKAEGTKDRPKDAPANWVSDYVPVEQVQARCAEGGHVECGKLNDEDEKLLGQAIATARTAIDSFGGKAHVWLGWHARKIEKTAEEAPENVGKMQRSFTVTVTTIG